MDATERQHPAQVGDAFVSSDDTPLGTVVAVEAQVLTVEAESERGRWQVPIGAITTYEPGRVYLNYTADEAAQQDWDVPAGDEEG